MSVTNLKLLVWQASNEEYLPSQQRLYYDGAELLDDSASLGEVCRVCIHHLSCELGRTPLQAEVGPQTT